MKKYTTPNQMAFIEAYRNIVDGANVEEIKEFFVYHDDLEDLVPNHEHIMDCWLLWNESQLFLKYLLEEDLDLEYLQAEVEED